MHTQFFENYNGSTTPHQPRKHGDESAARAYAVELSNRREGSVAVLKGDGTPIATYVDGQLAA